MAEAVKRCRLCGNDLPLAEFGKANKQGRLATICKPCDRARQRAYRLANIEQRRAYDQARYRNQQRPRKVYEPQPCTECGAEYTPRGHTHRYCSEACVQLGRKRIARESDRKRTAAGKGKERWQQIKGDPVLRAKEREKNRRAQAKRRGRPAAKPSADALRRRAAKNKRAAAKRRLKRAAAGPSKRRTWYMGWCPECGESFASPQPHQTTCSKRCATRRNKGVRRARKRRAYVEDVYRVKVYERDNWHCQICHRPVRRDVEVPHHLAPTLDHIVALAHGGEHSYANVQLAHFICNARKSHGPAQLRMVA